MIGTSFCSRVTVTDVVPNRGKQWVAAEIEVGGIKIAFVIAYMLSGEGFILIP